MFKDKIVNGIMVGILADAVKLGFNYLSFRLNFTPVVFWQLVSATVLAKSDALSPGGILIGALADLVVASFIGVLFIYFVYLTGKENLWLKGIFFGMIVWLNFFVIVQGVLISDKIPPEPSGILVTFAAHFIFGIFLAAFSRLLTGNISTAVEDMKKIQSINKTFKLITSVPLKEHLKSIVKPRKI